MSVMTHRHHTEIPVASGQADHGAIASAATSILDFMRKAAAGTGKILIHIAEAHAEARLQRANIEIEFYRHRHNKYSSKNDDDLPIVR
jgi:hypothetical protein